MTVQRNIIRTRFAVTGIYAPNGVLVAEKGLFYETLQKFVSDIKNHRNLPCLADFIARTWRSNADIVGGNDSSEDDINQIN